MHKKMKWQINKDQILVKGQSVCTCMWLCLLYFKANIHERIPSFALSFLFQSTVHGHCLTDYVVNAQKDIATDVTLSRDLSQCDQFYSRGLANSPMALLQKLVRH